MLDAGVDAVTITTPPHTRHELVMEAIAAGVHVVADKPFAPNAASARELAEAAARAGVVLNVYHNRRRDADILTLANVLASGELGETWRVHSTMDQDDAGSLETRRRRRAPAGSGQPPGGPDAVAAGTGDPRPRDPRLDGPLRRAHRLRLLVTMTHASGAVSTVSASKLNHSTTRELRAYGSGGSYIASGADVQAEALMPGRRPVEEPATWGIDAAGKLGHPVHEGRPRARFPRRRGTMPASTPSSPAQSAAKAPDRCRRRKESGRWRCWTRPAAVRWRTR